MRDTHAYIVQNVQTYMYIYINIYTGELSKISRHGSYYNTQEMFFDLNVFDLNVSDYYSTVSNATQSSICFEFKSWQMCHALFILSRQRQDSQVLYVCKDRGGVESTLLTTFCECRSSSSPPPPPPPPPPCTVRRCRLSELR